MYSERMITDGEWHHVAASYSGPPGHRGSVFINGEKDHLLIKPFSADTGDGSRWTVGVFMGGGLPFRGQLDDLRIFNRSLLLGEVRAIYRCSSPGSDLSLPVAGRAYYLPLGNTELEMDPRLAGSVSVPLTNRTPGLAAVQFAVSDAHCGIESLRGVPLAGGLRVRMKVEVPRWAEGNASAAGPFFGVPPLTPRQRLDERGRQGVWVGLDSDGRISVRRLSVPFDQADGLLAATKPVAGFDDRQPHNLDVEFRMGKLRVWMDDSPVPFFTPDSGAEPEYRVAAEISGAAGVAFYNRGKPLYSLPQRVTDIVLESDR